MDRRRFYRTSFGLFDGALDFLEFLQVWQTVEVFKSEGLQKLRRGCVDDGPSRRFLTTCYLDKAPLQQGFEHSAGIDAAQLFQFGTRDGLAVGDDRDGLQQRSAKARRPRGEQLANVGGVFLQGAELVATRDFLEPEATILGRVLRAHRGERLLDFATGRVVERSLQARQGNRLASSE